jgi:hypothetical protein
MMKEIKFIIGVWIVAGLLSAGIAAVSIWAICRLVIHFTR